SRPRAAFPTAARLVAPASFRFRARFPPARLPFRFLSTTIPARSPAPEKHARLCPHLQSAISLATLLPCRSTACCAPAAEVPPPWLQFLHASAACCEIFSSTPVASSITSKLEPP